VSDLPRYRPAQLTAWAAEILSIVDTPGHIAATVARHLVEADVSGHRGHGLTMLPTYLEAIAAGRLNVRAEPVTLAQRPSHLIVDGQHGFGHHALTWTLRRVVGLAKQHGLAGAHLVRCGHVGRLGGYVLDGVQESAAVLLTVGSLADDDDALVTPYGGSERLLGTNPIAFGCPGNPPLVVDMATSVMAYYDVVRLAAAGAEMPHGVLVDGSGQPVVRLGNGLADLNLLPFGGYKGYGLSLLIGVLSGLAGADAGRPPDRQPAAPPLNGVFVLALDVPQASTRAVDATLSRIRLSRPVDSAKPVLVPGDRARVHRDDSEAAGVGLPLDLVSRLQASLAGFARTPPRLPDPVPGSPPQAAVRASVPREE